jgi:hypothetical protein
VTGKHPGCRDKQCCQIQVFILTIDCVLCEVSDKTQKKELSFGHATQQSVLTVRYELRLKKLLNIKSIINTAQPDGSVLADEVYVCCAVKNKKRTG